MEKVRKGLIKAQGLLLTVIITFDYLPTHSQTIVSAVSGMRGADQFETGWSDYIFALVAFLILILFYLLNRPKVSNNYSPTLSYPIKKQFNKKTNPHNNKQSRDEN